MLHGHARNAQLQPSINYRIVGVSIRVRVCHMFEKVSMASCIDIGDHPAILHKAIIRLRNDIRIKPYHGLFYDLGRVAYASLSPGHSILHMSESEQDDLRVPIGSYAVQGNVCAICM